MKLETKYQHLLQRIERITQLQENWNSYDAPKPDKTSLQNAINTLEHLMHLSRSYPEKIDYLPVSILPTPESILFTFVTPSKTQEIFKIEFYPDNDIVVTQRKNNDTTAYKDFKISDMSDIIRKLEEFLFIYP